MSHFIRISCICDLINWGMLLCGGPASRLAGIVWKSAINDIYHQLLIILPVGLGWIWFQLLGSSHQRLCIHI